MTEEEARLSPEAERLEKQHYHRHLAAEIVTMLPYRRADALAVMALVH
jgi:hypothetical protein